MMHIFKASEEGVGKMGFHFFCTIPLSLTFV